MKLTLTGYSTALFSTWILVEELGILFDCGDGAVSGLLQKSRKARHVFISHADWPGAGSWYPLEVTVCAGNDQHFHAGDCGAVWSGSGPGSTRHQTKSAS